MANFSYGDAKHLPELKEVSKDSTKIRDFIAAVKAYHVKLTAEGQTRTNREKRKDHGDRTGREFIF
jgi:hypothetical protein